MSRLRPLLFVLVLSLLLAAPPAGASVPQGFVGMDADGPVFDPHLSLAHQLDSMVASGVESLRMTFSWAAAQPYRSWAEVPLADAGTFQNGVGDVPTDFSLTDQVVALAAQRHLISLPVVIYAPSWEASSNPADAIAVAPQSDGPYAAFLQTLIKR